MFTGSLVSHADFDVTTQSLWRVGESCTSLFLLSCQVISNPGHERGIHLHRCQLITYEGQSDGTECSGGGMALIKKHDSDGHPHDRVGR